MWFHYAFEMLNNVYVVNSLAATHTLTRDDIFLQIYYFVVTGLP